jgi:hypothetical protein
MPIRLRLYLACALLLPCLGGRGKLSAQQPEGPIVSGVVLDAASGVPVPGALIALAGQGLRAITDSTGAFRLQGGSAAQLQLSVQRYGYRTTDLRIVLPTSPEPLTIRLEPDPVQLDALVVTGGARVDMNGRVLDAATRQPVPWAAVELTRDAVREAAHTSADDDGAFTLEDVPSGAYLLRVDRIGYQSQLLPVGAFASSDPLEVLLEPDSLMMSGLAAMDRELGSRRSAAPYLVRVYDERRLRLTASPDVRHFLRNLASLRWTGCQGSETMDCVIHRQAAVPPRVYIDELIRNLEDLESFEPSDLFQLETYTCSRRVEIRAYTVRYMEQAAKHPRIVLPPC